MSNKIKINDYNFGEFEFDIGDLATVSSNTQATFTISDMNSSYITIKDPYQEKLDSLEDKIEKIMERMAVLDEPDPEKLEKYKSLRKAYEKYKMLEKLCGAEDD